MPTSVPVLLGRLVCWKPIGPKPSTATMSLNAGNEVGDSKPNRPYSAWIASAAWATGAERILRLSKPLYSYGITSVLAGNTVGKRRSSGRVGPLGKTSENGLPGSPLTCSRIDPKTALIVSGHGRLLPLTAAQ